MASLVRSFFLHIYKKKHHGMEEKRRDTMCRATAICKYLHIYVDESIVGWFIYAYMLVVCSNYILYMYVPACLDMYSFH